MTRALIAGLKSGHIRAAGLDVYDGEPKVNPGYLTTGECHAAAASRQRHHRDARCHGAPGSGESGCGAAEGHRRTGSGGLNEQGPAAPAAGPDFVMPGFQARAAFSGASSTRWRGYATSFE